MDQSERRAFLLRALLKERPQYRDIAVPQDERGQRDLLRALMNVRPPAPIGQEFLTVQDAYLSEAISEKGITRLADLKPVRDRLYLWRGDITTLAVDAIVNAANSGMTGCYQPLHMCIDNCIHTYAGVQLRYECGRIMDEQGYEEPTGSAKITPAYNLPSKYVLHTVGPIVQGRLTKRHEDQLASCYRACLELAMQNDIHSVAFCCISTGVFGFPKQRAAEIAVNTVQQFCANHPDMEVVFNVFSEEDEVRYSKLLA